MTNQPFENYIPVLRSNNIKKSKIDLSDLVYVNPLKIKDKQLLKKGDILITASTGSIKVIGKNASCEKDYNAAFGAFCKVVRPKNIDENYLKHMFQSPQYFGYIQNIVNGANINNIKNEHIDNFKIPLPPLKTQQHIAQILDDAAALRDKTKQLLTEYDLLAQSIFLEMFGDPVINSKGWNKKPLKKLGKTITGNTPPRATPEYYGNFIEWIKTDNINTPYMYLTPAAEYLSKIGMDKGRVVDEGAILVTCIAGSRKVIGNVSIADRSVSFNQQINAFVPFNDCSLFWYYHFIMAKSYVQNNSTDGMKGIITKGKFEKMFFIDPPLELQNQFADKIALIEQQKALAKQELQESEDLFNCLLQRAFKGELV